MCEKVLNQSITLKQYISEKEYKEVKQLEELCYSKDKTDLKLELDFKLNMCQSPKIGLKNTNEFFYYVDGLLVSYLGLSSFGANIGEINGMTHPDFRRKGLFKKLFKLAIDESRIRNFDKLLLLSNGESNSGIEFVRAEGGIYDFSEYRMTLKGKAHSNPQNSIRLRKAEKSDSKEICRQDAIFWGNAKESEDLSEEEEASNTITYMIELNGEIIGKIRVDYLDNSAYICGFGILPDFRGKGYGKAALEETLNLINQKGIYDMELDVACKNDTALNLYKSCGFCEKSVMNYYEYNINFR